MKRTTIAIIIILFASPAVARHHRHHYHSFHTALGHGLSHMLDQAKPRLWCGWFMRHQVGHDPGSRYNLAANWREWGHATTPHDGAIVVWWHHVGKLIHHVAGNVWVVLSGNDGHAIRSRPRSISGAIAFRE